MNKVILLGRLTRDVEIRYTQSAEPMAVASFALAVDRAYKKDGKTETDFFNCVCFGKRGESISQYFHKGNKIAVSGRLQVNNYTDKEGNKRTSINVVVEEFDFCENKGSGEQPQSYPQSAPANNSGPDGFEFTDAGSYGNDLPF